MYLHVLCSRNASNMLKYQQDGFPAETAIIVPENSLALYTTLTPFGSVEWVGFTPVRYGLLADFVGAESWLSSYIREEVASCKLLPATWLFNNSAEIASRRHYGIITCMWPSFRKTLIKWHNFLKKSTYYAHIMPDNAGIICAPHNQQPMWYVQ